MTSLDQPDAVELRARFAAALEPGHPSPWRAAFAQVPRDNFVPSFYSQDERGRWYQVEANDPDYLRTVYSDTALTTQLSEQGIPTSSSSEPGLMLAMLDALDAEEGDSVFELGTGTGYNAALLASRLGSDQVVSVEVDSDLAHLARGRIARSGHHPTVVVGDGAEGYRARAPYDCIIATAALRSISSALMDQVSMGAVIVAPIGFGVVKATVAEPGHAEGRFLPRPALFMPRRVSRRGPDFDALAGQEPKNTPVPVAQVLDWWKFPLSLALPSYSSCSWRSDDGELVAVGLWTEDGSTASATVQGQVRQTGPQRLWDTVEELSALFPEGAPAREDFGITITPEAQGVWYGDPEGAYWSLPTD